MDDYFADGYFANGYFADGYFAGSVALSVDPGGGGNASGNVIDSYKQRTRRKKRELAALLRELYDMSPDP